MTEVNSGTMTSECSLLATGIDIDLQQVNGMGRRTLPEMPHNNPTLTPHVGRLSQLDVCLGDPVDDSLTEHHIVRVVHPLYCSLGLIGTEHVGVR